MPLERQVGETISYPNLLVVKHYHARFSVRHLAGHCLSHSREETTCFIWCQQAAVLGIDECSVPKDFFLLHQGQTACSKSCSSQVLLNVLLTRFFLVKLIVSLNRDPFIVKRVRSLVLGPSLAEEVFEQHGQWAKPENPLLRMRNARGYFKQGISSCDLIANMISVVRGFNSITELTIDSESDTLFPLVGAILDSSRSLLKLKITHIFVLSFLPSEFTFRTLCILMSYWRIKAAAPYIQSQRQFSSI